MWITFQILHHFEVCGSHCYLCCTHFIIPESLLNHPHSFHGGMFKLKAKFDADSLLYLCSHFECDSHTVQMLTQWHLSLLPTSTVKLPLFTHAHSSPLTLAARLHRCHTNRSHYINNGCTFSGQTSRKLIHTSIGTMHSSWTPPRGLLWAWYGSSSWLNGGGWGWTTGQKAAQKI